ncbi:MAG: hypothetical protein M3Z31_18005 [Pseudomonadota bacterium]|nr:hypothetical protein [Pseudomonadota bacterium]
MNRFIVAGLLYFAHCVIALAQTGPARVLSAVEFYHSGLDRYFVSADAGEVALLDDGGMGGWARTGLEFAVVDPDQIAMAGANPVCRLYASVAGAEDLHFLSASPDECAQAIANAPDVWVLESQNAFGAFLPDARTGGCPDNTVPLYRSFTPQRGDHRYTTDAKVQISMIEQGWLAEGYGAFPVSMCVMRQQ